MNLRRPIAGALLVFCLATGSVGCGSGGSETSTSEFQIDVPGVSTTTIGAEPGSGTGVNPDLPDTKENDLPPQPGSPQDAFEKFCNEHPDACG